MLLTFYGDGQQIVGRERRERVSQLAWCGGGCFDSRRRVNSTVRRLTSSRTFAIGGPMKNPANAVLIILLLAACTVAQPNKSAGRKNYVRVETSEDGASSELLPMPLAMTPNLSGAEIGIKYFGVQSD